MKNIINEFIELLKKDSTIDVTATTVFAEAENDTLYLILETSPINSNWDMQLFFCNDLITDTNVIEEVEGWIYNHIQSVDTTNDAFSTKDKQHATNLIYS